jgi:hypothetical protein
MIDEDVKAQFKILDDRLARVEQFLPSVATKDDLAQTRSELCAALASKEDLKAERRELDADIATLATKEDLRAERRELDAVIATLATKEDLKAGRRELDGVIATLATKEDLKAERRELDAVIATLATKEDLKAFATKDDLKAFPTRDEMRAAIHEAAAQTRTHFDVIAESLRDEIRIALEGHSSTTSRVASLEGDCDRLDAKYEQVDRRVTALESRGATKRRK